jgi:hypothetical protein
MSSGVLRCVVGITFRVEIYFSSHCLILKTKEKTIKLKSMVDHNRYETPCKRRYTAPSGVGEHYCSQHSSLPLSKARPW